MRRAIGLGAATFAALALWSGNAVASTTFHPRVGGALGLFPSYADTDVATGAETAVDYHGGAVMDANVAVHTIFWAPAGYSFTPGYEALLKQFLTDAAAASGTTSNVFSVLHEYGQQTGSATAVPGSYSIAYDAASDSSDDVDPYPSSGGCASPNGVPTCLTDGQIQAEIDAVAPADERGLGNIWFVLLPANVDECITVGSCGTNSFAGYHEEMDRADGLTIYSVIIDPIVEVVPGPGADPEGNPDAEATIDTVAHETVEAITDPEGTGWMDPDGYEVADKCETGPEIGNPLGYAANGSPYNQLIGGHEYLIQEMWSNDDGGCVQRTTQTASPLPLPQVNLTQFSSTVSGNIGSNTAAVKVTVAVYRKRRGGRANMPQSALATEVAKASATTGANGEWSLSLAPFAVGDDRDLITVTYSGTPLPPDFITTGSGGNAFEEGGWTGWTDLDNGADFSSGDLVTLGPCFQTGVLTLDVGTTAYSANDTCNTQTDTATITTGPISAGEAVTFSSVDNRAFTQPQPLGPSLDAQGNETGALVDLSVKLGEPGAQSTFSSPLADVLPLMRLTGFPTCTADLQFGVAVCSGLVPGDKYRVTRARGAETLSGHANHAGTLVVGPFGGAPPLTGGDLLTLSNGRRVLTTLHLAHLRAVVDGEQTVLAAGSRCQPGLYYGAPPTMPSPASSVAGLTGQNGATLTGRICPPSGSAQGLSDEAVMQADDRSGGLTQTEVPDISTTSPIDGETVYGPFTARAQATFLGPHDRVIPSGYPISLTITPANRIKPGITLDDVNTASGTPIKRLKPGTYIAIWSWHDFNGDSHTIATSFVEEPASGSTSSVSAPAKKVDCPLARSAIVCDVRAGRLRLGGTVQRFVRGPQQSGARDHVSFTFDPALAGEPAGLLAISSLPLDLGAAGPLRGAVGAGAVKHHLVF
ncbi:MAG: hypothetical protein ABSB73_09070 [Solirubrobacteraceae bacterium]